MLLYKISPKVLPINNIEEREIVGLVDNDEYIKIIEYLSMHNTGHSKEINKIYSNFRQSIFK